MFSGFYKKNDTSELRKNTKIIAVVIFHPRIVSLVLRLDAGVLSV